MTSSTRAFTYNECLAWLGVSTLGLLYAWHQLDGTTWKVTTAIGGLALLVGTVELLQLVWQTISSAVVAAFDVNAGTLHNIRQWRATELDSLAQLRTLCPQLLAGSTNRQCTELITHLLTAYSVAPQIPLSPHIRGLGDIVRNQEGLYVTTKGAINATVIHPPVDGFAEKPAFCQLLTCDTSNHAGQPHHALYKQLAARLLEANVSMAHLYAQLS